MNNDEERTRSRRVKELIHKGIYLQEAQKIAYKESAQRQLLSERLKGRVPNKDNPDFTICEHYPEE